MSKQETPSRVSPVQYRPCSYIGNIMITQSPAPEPPREKEINLFVLVGGAGGTALLLMLTGIIILQCVILCQKKKKKKQHSEREGKNTPK